MNIFLFFKKKKNSEFRVFTHSTSPHVRRMAVRTNIVINLVGFKSLIDTRIPIFNPWQIVCRFDRRNELLKEPIDKR